MNRYANILFDDTFKVVICAPGNEALLIRIIELLIPGKHVKSLVLRDKENHGLSVSDKITTFDLYCTSENGEQFIVEMQYSAQNSFADRMLCYSTYPIRAQLAAKLSSMRERRANGEKPDKMDYSLKPVYVVSMLNFSIKHSSPDALDNGLVSRYGILNAGNGETMTEALHFVYLELGRLVAKVDEPHKCKTLLEQFAYSLKYMHKLPQRPDGFDDPLLVELYNATEFANWPPDKQLKYDDTMRTELDIIAIKTYAQEEGHREGRQEEKSEIAKKMLAKGYNLEDIADITGFTPSQVKELQ